MADVSITLVVGIDANCFEQLKLSWRTWRLNRPEMWGWPMLLFFDRDQLSYNAVVDFGSEVMRHPNFQAVSWPLPGTPREAYSSQRDLMLSGHLFVPAQCATTEYAMKLDTDATARPHPRWLEQEWFAPDDRGRLPAWVCPRWFYTKGKQFLPILERWADGIPGIGSMPRLNIPQEPDQLRVGHARMCSWCSYFNCDFLRWAAETCWSSLSEFRLPVPSHDTVLFYLSERTKLHKKIASQKAVGWDNHPRMAVLVNAVNAILK